MLVFRRFVKYSLLWSVAVTAILAGCSKGSVPTGPASASSAAGMGTEALPPSLTLFSPKAPSLIPALSAGKRLDAGKWKLNVETWDTLEQLLARVQSGDVPFIAAPLNVGANMAARGMPLQLLHVNTWGSMYLVSTSPDVHSLGDLAQGTVYIPGQSGPPDILTRYLLREEGLDGKVKLAYSAVPEIMQQLAAGTAKHAVLPEPALSSLRVKMQGKLHQVVDFQDVWQRKLGDRLPQSGIFVNSQWAKTHQDEVGWFQELYKSALEETVRNPGSVTAVAAEAMGMPEPVVAEALPKMTLDFQEAMEAKPAVERYFKVLLQSAPDSIGGRLPDAGFYYGH